MQGKEAKRRIAENPMPASLVFPFVLKMAKILIEKEMEKVSPPLHASAVLRDGARSREAGHAQRFGGWQREKSGVCETALCEISCCYSMIKRGDCKHSIRGTCTRKWQQHSKAKNRVASKAHKLSVYGGWFSLFMELNRHYMRME